MGSPCAVPWGGRASASDLFFFCFSRTNGWNPPTPGWSSERDHGLKQWKELFLRYSVSLAENGTHSAWAPSRRLFLNYLCKEVCSKKLPLPHPKLGLEEEDLLCRYRPWSLGPLPNLCIQVYSQLLSLAFLEEVDEMLSLTLSHTFRESPKLSHEKREKKKKLQVRLS